MCFGGGGGGGTITMPDTGAYDAMLDRQIRAMESAQNGAVKQKQAELDAALRAQTNAMRDLKDARIERANEVASVEAEARRLSNIIGTPEPEPTAQAPVIGRNRDANPNARRGKRGLRIARATATSSGVGTGLNIT